jgi:hypothetical protein
MRVALTAGTQPSLFHVWNALGRVPLDQRVCRPGFLCWIDAPCARGLPRAIARGPPSGGRAPRAFLLTQWPLIRKTVDLRSSTRRTRRRPPHSAAILFVCSRCVRGGVDRRKRMRARRWRVLKGSAIFHFRVETKSKPVDWCRPAVSRNWWGAVETPKSTAWLSIRRG